MTVTVPELVPEASLRTQRAVFFPLENFRGQTELGHEGKSVSRSGHLFHTQECKMLHSHSFRNLATLVCGTLRLGRARVPHIGL